MTQTPDPWTPAPNARIEWAKVLDDIAYLLGDALASNELLREPVSQEKLAAAIGFPRGTLRNWLDGSEPRHSDGEVLLAWWCRLTGKARTFAPVDRVVFSAHKVAPIATKPNVSPRAGEGHGKAVLVAVASRPVASDR